MKEKQYNWGPLGKKFASAREEKENGRSRGERVFLPKGIGDRRRAAIRQISRSVVAVGERRQKLTERRKSGRRKELFERGDVWLRDENPMQWLRKENAGSL